MDKFIVGFAFAGAAFVVYLIGWDRSASTIGHECETLGAFYVGTTVYECKIKEKNT